MKLDPTIEAYVIADYLMTAGVRLRITDRAVLEATRRALQRYPDSLETEAALAFLQVLEAASAFDDWKSTREENAKLRR